MGPVPKTVKDDIYDDDSDNDSDYCPDADPEAGNASGEDVEDTKLSSISHSRKRKVDDLWATMQEELSSKESAQKSSSSSSSSSKKSSKKGLKNKEANDILASIFGKRQAGNIMNGVSGSKSAGNAESLSVQDAARESVKMLQKKTRVTETRKFAGQEITIERTVKGSASSSSASTNKNSGVLKMSALDSVLDSIKGPKTVSTVAKSNFDWETYKEKEGLEDELSAATKEGFLTRKDFLERCDYRAYETERDERLTKMSSNAK